MSGEFSKCPLCDKATSGKGGYLSHLSQTHKLSRQEIYDRYHKVDGDGLCVECGSPTMFYKRTHFGYMEACKEHQYSVAAAKRKQNALKKHGVSHVNKLRVNREHIREARSKVDEVAAGVKRQRTNGDKYGVAFAGQIEEGKVKAKKKKQELYGENFEKISEKVHQTNVERTGYDWPGQVPETKEKIKETFADKYENGHPLKDISVRSLGETTNLERYGSINPSQSKEIQRKMSTSMVEYHRGQVIDRLKLGKLEVVGTYKGAARHFARTKLRCIVCNNEFSDYINAGFTPLCPKCYPRGRSLPEQEINKLLIDEGFESISNDRTVLGGLEIDVYLPGYKLGIEYDDNYWHSDGSPSNPSKDQHQIKHLEAVKADITLLQIFSHEWYNKRPIIESMINQRLGRCSRIFARKCIVYECLDTTLVNTFYDDNHLKGRVGSNKHITFVLEHEGVIVGMMTFNQPTFGKGYKTEGNDYHLDRYASKLGIQIIGGFSRLLKAFERLYSPDQIITYADARYSVGQVYHTNGFTPMDPHITKPGYFYTRGSRSHFSRQKFMKHLLSKRLENFDPALSESANMRNHGFFRVYDSGHYRFIKKF